jgi:tetratricopeptide (TPR) repeat protein
MAQYEEALRVQPDRAQVHNNFGNALFKTGRRAEGIAHYEQALRIDPNAMSALVNLALIRAADPDPRLRNGAEAVALAQRACAISGPSSLGCLDTLAAAYAEAQRFDEAVKSAEQAVALARGTRQDALADALETRLRLYRDHRPYRAETISQAPASK